MHHDEYLPYAVLTQLPIYNDLFVGSKEECEERALDHLGSGHQIIVGRLHKINFEQLRTAEIPLNSLHNLVYRKKGYFRYLEHPGDYLHQEALPFADQYYILKKLKLELRIKG